MVWSNRQTEFKHGGCLLGRRSCRSFVDDDGFAYRPLVPLCPTLLVISWKLDLPFKSCHIFYLLDINIFMKRRYKNRKNPKQLNESVLMKGVNEGREGRKKAEDLSFRFYGSCGLWELVSLLMNGLISL